MADIPNQSGNRRPPNTLAELGASVMPSSISRTLENVSPENTQRYQRLTEQIGRIQEDPFYQLGQRNPMLLTNPDAAKQYRALENRMSSYKRQQEIMEEAATGRANRMIGTSVNQSFAASSINGQISDRLGTTAAQQDALRIASNVSPEALQRNIRRSEGRVRRYGEEAAKLETVNKFGERDPETEERLQQLYGLRELEINRRTGMTGAARIHRLQGLDPESRTDSLVGLVSKARTTLGKESLDIKNLTSLSASDFKKREVDAAEKLTQAFEKLSQVSDTTSDQFKSLKKDVDDAEKQFKNVQTARGMGGGGGGGPSGWQLAGAGFNAGAMAFQQIGVNQRLAQMGNITGYANFQNEAYQTYKAANAGDVASLMLLPQFQAAENFGFGLKAAANVSVGLRGAGGAAQIGAGAAQMGVGGFRSGAGDVMGGTATTAEAVFDLARGVSGRQADVAGRQARIAVARALQATGAEQLQGFRDFGVGLGIAAQGLGGGGEAFLHSTATAGMLGRLSAARIGPDQFAQLAQQGVNSMGGGFSTEQIFGARALERRGLGSAQTNLERMSQLYMAGANNPQQGLGIILEQAIPKGFDNSKLVGQLVQYSAQAAQNAGGIGTGLNLTGAAATLLTTGITPTTANKEAMLQHTADLQGAFRGVETNITTSYAGMVSVARAQRALGRGGIEAVIAESTPTEVLMSLKRETDPTKQKQALIRAGLSPSTTPSQLDNLIRNRQLKELESGGTGFIFGNQTSGLLDRIVKSGGKLGDKDQQLVSQIAALERINTGADVRPQDLINRVLGTGTGNIGGTGKGVFSDQNVGKLQKSMDDLRTQGFVQLSTAAFAAAKSLDPLVQSTGAIEKLATAFKEVEKTIGTTEKAAPTAAARGATGGQGFDTTQWDLAAKKLNVILDRIITKQGGGPVPNQRAGMSGN